jgi:hypothetical protein
METFLPYQLNKAILKNDKESLNNLLPYRVALNLVLFLSEMKRGD